MFVASANFKLKLEEFQKEVSIPLLSNETERKVFRLVNQWINGEKRFTFHTSGSTGQPKEIQINRDKIITSTTFTFDLIDPHRKINNCLLCIDPSFIGGAMVVFRALIMDLDLYIIEPTSQLLDHLPNDFRTDLVSMVPLQFRALSANEVEQFQNILIGGAAIDLSVDPSFRSAVYESFGMTETVSHIALRRVNEPFFHTIGDAIVSLTDEGCLRFKGTITNHVWLDTNDIGKIISENSFEWMGRKDFVINSGGIKLNPEKIEEKLKKQLDSKFIITSLPDEKLGEKVVLVLENTISPNMEFDALDRYEKPKLIVENHAIALTSSGKIDRVTTRKNLIKSRK